MPISPGKLFLSALVLSIAAQAAEPEPVVFSRAEIRILPDPDAPAPKTAGDKTAIGAEQGSEPPPRVPHRFEAVIKPASALRADGMFSQAAIEKGNAVLYVYPEPQDEGVIGYANIFAIVDILAIGPDGAILAIVPSVMPSELFEPVVVKAKTKALMHLKAGASAASDIRPKDRVSHEMFSQKPVVLQ